MFVVIYNQILNPMAIPLTCAFSTWNKSNVVFPFVCINCQEKKACIFLEYYCVNRSAECIPSVIFKSIFVYCFVDGFISQSVSVPLH